MFRHRRLRDPGPRRERANRLLAAAAQAFEDRAPGGIGERPEKHILCFRHQINNPLVMDLLITTELWIRQAGT
jgi:hypothetical protein